MAKRIGVICIYLWEKQQNYAFLIKIYDLDIEEPQIPVRIKENEIEIIKRSHSPEACTTKRRDTHEEDETKEDVKRPVKYMSIGRGLARRWTQIYKKIF